METTIVLPEFTAKKAFTYLKHDTSLLDVRENEEVQELIFDLPHIIYIPLSELSRRYQEIPQNSKLIVACKGGNRSMTAAEFLIQQGFEEIINLKEGLNSWVINGLPTKGDTSSILAGGSCFDGLDCSSLL